MEERVTAKTPRPAEPKPVAADEDDQDEKPYVVSKLGPSCPQCDEELPGKGDVCPACGWQLEAAPAPTFEPLKCEWEANPDGRKRWRIFIAYEIGLLLLGVVTGLLDALSPLELVVHGLVASALAAYCLGTFDRLDLRRGQNGRVMLSKSWRFCFMPWSTTKIALRGYESLATCQDYQHGFFDWVALLWLFSLGCLPGILWGFLVFTKPVHQVALTRDHGFPAMILYRGRDEKHMRDIAKTVSEVCHFRVRL